jgi:ferritin
MDFNKNIFKNKTFGNILEEIYTNSKSKEKQITKLINDLVPYIKSPGDAVTLVPLLQKYIELGIKNDDQIVKMASIVQRSMNEKDEEGNFVIPDRDRDELFKLAKGISETTQSPSDN